MQLSHRTLLKSYTQLYIIRAHARKDKFMVAYGLYHLHEAKMMARLWLFMITVAMANEISPQTAVEIGSSRITAYYNVRRTLPF